MLKEHDIEVKEERRNLYIGMCERFTFLNCHKSFLFNIKLKINKLLLKLIELLDLNKEYHNKLVDDANRLLNDSDDFINSSAMKK